MPANKTAPDMSLVGRTRRLLRAAVPERMRTMIRELRGLTPPQRAHYLRAMLREEPFRTLPSGLDAGSRIVFVCYGNIFRSPMAEATFAEEFRRRELPAAGITSAGLFAKDGREAHEKGVDVARGMGIALGAHRARLLTAEVVAANDLIVVMDRINIAVMLDRFPESQHRVVLLGAFDPDAGNLGAVIADPYGRPRDEVVACYRRIARATAVLAQRIVSAATTRPTR